MDEKPQRKSLRLKEYDYNTAGFYFITICTKDRECFLSDIVTVGDADHCVPSIYAKINVQLTHYGKIAEKYLLTMESIHRIHVHKYCIMPNHIHILIEINDLEQNGTQRAASPTNNRVSQAIRSFKCLTNKECGIKLWQRSFYDHVIRDEQDFARIWEYIDTNPTKWTDDDYYN